MPYTRHKLAPYAESYEIRVKNTVIGRAFQSADVWKGVDFDKKSTQICRNLEDAADLVWVTWEARCPKERTRW